MLEHGRDGDSIADPANIVFLSVATQNPNAGQRQDMVGCVHSRCEALGQSWSAKSTIRPSGAAVLGSDLASVSEAEEA